ncbi:MAG: 16S rRNA (adenine(1518)-N(6)/adenine(1519)-N(6))-dimethyltransferase RsmA [Candidatus Bathyarchaeia archaeon]
MERRGEPSLLSETYTLLRRYGVKPRWRLGQSFMLDTGLLDRMVAYAEVTSGDTVLEVGAGLGYLTKRLAERAGQVIAVEIEPRLVQALNAQLEGWGNVSIIQGDFRKATLPAFNKVVSNPPYSASSDLVLSLLNRRLDQAVLTFQDEFAEKLLASPGTPHYGRLSVAAGLKWLVEPLEHVGRSAFYPAPKVDSTLVMLRPRGKPLKVPDWRRFLELVTFLFSQRRRRVRKALGVYLARRPEAAGIIRHLSDLPYGDLRVHELPLAGFVLLANLLEDRLKDET